MCKDSYNQEINVGDWVAGPAPGGRNMLIGKVCGFTKTNNPKVKKSSKSDPTTFMIKMEFSNKLGYFGAAKFVKVIPTREIELYYENN